MQKKNDIDDMEGQAAFVGTPCAHDLHERIKIAAQKEGVSLSLFLRRACVQRIRSQESQGEERRSGS